ncbi:MAG: ABC transporter permease [Candidatus Limnocylindrales bacterium]
MTTPSSEAIPRAATAAPGRGPIALVTEGLRELAGRRRLVRYLVGADLKRTHADTVLGQLWWILDPLLQMGVYVVLVSVIFQRRTPDFPLFLFAAILPWKWFSTTLSDATLAVTGRGSLIRQLQFPKIVLPAASTFAGTVSFGFGLVALAMLYLFFLHRLTPWVLAIPLIAGVQLVFTLALAVGLAAMNAFYRDVQNVLRHALRLWFYLSPALYSLEDIPAGPLRSLLALNPMAPILESYRDVIWGTASTGGVAPDVIGLLAVLALSLVLLAVAIAIFKRAEPAFARIL